MKKKLKIKTLFSTALLNHKKNDFNEAIRFYKKVLEIDPNHFETIFHLGSLFLQIKKLNLAKEMLEKAIKIKSNYADANNNLGNVLVELGEFKKAVNFYKKSINNKPNQPDVYYNYGNTLRKLGKYKKAINCYEKVIKIKPNYMPAQHNLALVHQELGEFKKSIKYHKMAIKNEPENLIHYFFLSELNKEILDLTLKSKIRKIIADNKSVKINLVYGNYLLAKYERKTKSYEKEMNYLMDGHQNFFNIHKEKFELGVKYCFNILPKIVKEAKMKEISKKQDYEMKPIFIIGVPRCGSTLLEKIIGSGEKLIPLGEEIGAIENIINSRISKYKSLNIGSVKDIRKELFNLYNKKGLISKKYNYKFTDKSLDNFFYLNLIKEIYPNAKIINCKRDALSSIMSIFQNNLAELTWTHNLENIFKYFNNYFEITRNFSKNYPNFIYQLQFEKLVANPVEESKKLMEFCELPWHKKCLEFYKRKGLISKTASNVQIRKAIFKHSSGKYSPYKKFLDKYGKQYSWFN